MRDRLRQSVFAKIVAIGFVLLILFGHFSLFVPKSWVLLEHVMELSLVVGLVGVVGGGLGLAYLYIFDH